LENLSLFIPLGRFLRKHLFIPALQKIVSAKQDGAMGCNTLQAVENDDPASLIYILHDTR